MKLEEVAVAGALIVALFGILFIFAITDISNQEMRRCVAVDVECDTNCPLGTLGRALCPLEIE